VQYIKSDGTKRFAKESRKRGCFHVVGAPNGDAALQKIAQSPVVVIAEGYATAATIAKLARVPAIAAFDSGNLLAVARAIRERHGDKHIIIAGDDDHRLENNPGRSKALEAAAAVNAVLVFPDLSAEQRGQGMTDFNDLARENPKLVSRHLSKVLQQTHQKPLEQSTSVELTASQDELLSIRG
jgi:putative DNA primase/helicase